MREGPSSSSPSSSSVSKGLRVSDARGRVAGVLQEDGAGQHLRLRAPLRRRARFSAKQLPLAGCGIRGTPSQYAEGTLCRDTAVAETGDQPVGT